MPALVTNAEVLEVLSRKVGISKVNRIEITIEGNA